MTWLIRALLSLDRRAGRCARFFRMMRDELLWAFVPPSRRPKFTAWIYEHDPDYRPESAFFRAGLFDWERKAIETPPFPKSGTVLVGAAGAGRETVVLRKLGYRVVAFEILPLLSSCGKEIIPAGYGDLIAAAEGTDGPLREVVQRESFDAVIFGWGSFSNLLDPAERLSLLRATKKLAPRAIVLLSFLGNPSLPPGRIERFRENLRALLRRLGAKHLAGDGDVFLSTGGFDHLFRPEEIRSLADGAGYRIVAGHLLPYPHVLLDPAF